MTHAIRIERAGGPEELRWTEMDVGAPAEGEVRLAQTAVGLNFIDVYHRTGRSGGLRQRADRRLRGG